MLSQRLAQKAILRAVSRRTARQSGKSHYSTETTGGFKPQDNAFNREREAIKHHAAQSAETWRKLSIYVVFPALAIFSANAWTLWQEPWEHEAHRAPPSERPQYAYLNIRNKPYPWGDGQKTIFWNDKINYRKGQDEE